MVSFVTRFQATRGDPRLPADRVPSDLPPGLRAVHVGLGRFADRREHGVEAPLATQDQLLAVHQLGREDGMIVFAVENQGNWTCRCAPGTADPPVHCDQAAAIGEPRPLVAWAPCFV